jgi:hypothetical protein
MLLLRLVHASDTANSPFIVIFVKLQNDFQVLRVEFYVVIEKKHDLTFGKFTALIPLSCSTRSISKVLKFNLHCIAKVTKVIFYRAKITGIDNYQLLRQPSLLA